MDRLWMLSELRLLWLLCAPRWADNTFEHQLNIRDWLGKLQMELSPVKEGMPS
jgi:hypothetical protein